MKTGKLNSNPHCPKCDSLINGFTSVGHDCEPQDGDLTICVYCHAVLRFNAEQRTEAMTEDDLNLLDKDERENINNALSIVKQMTINRSKWI